MQATFAQGSIFKHISIMTFASTVGLLSVFLVDLVDMYWLSLLGDVSITAAIGYAGSILFFTVSLAIGLSIGCSALVSRAIGAGNREKTQQLIGNIFTAIFLLSVAVSLSLVLCQGVILEQLGATSSAYKFAGQYLVIVLPSMPIIGLVMAASAVMRAMGKARQAMFLTVLGGIINALLDPLFIFGFDLGIRGAAIATVLARVVMLLYGYKKIVIEYQLISAPSRASFVIDIKHYLKTAFPAVLTNLSTPIGVLYVTAVIAQFGDAAVAASAVIGKLQSLAFAGLFALSGAVGPIVGQNLGAQKYHRIMETYKSSLIFVIAYCAVACSLLLLLSNVIVAAFKAEGDTAYLLVWFCSGLSTVFIFNGITFVTNALFNNLNAAHWATVINFAKATVFTMPFASVGAHYGGALGVYIGVFVGAIIIAMLGAIIAYRKVSAVIIRESRGQ